MLPITFPKARTYLSNQRFIPEILGWKCLVLRSAITEFSAGARVFLEVGGYPEVPILEDAEIYRRLHRLGRMVQMRPESWQPRTYERYGPYRTTVVYFFILVLYVIGVPIAICIAFIVDFEG